MNLLRLIVIVCLLPTSIFSWSWFSTSQAAEKLDFACPNHCGQWGSESIQALEWQFILCLYEADKLQAFIENNLRKLDDHPKYFSLVKTQFLPQPEHFHSKWYQRMLVTSEYRRLFIQTGYDCYSEWGIFGKSNILIKPMESTLERFLNEVNMASPGLMGLK